MLDFIVSVSPYSITSTDYVPWKETIEVKTFAYWVHVHKAEPQCQKENNSTVKLGPMLLQLILLQSWTAHCLTSWRLELTEWETLAQVFLSSFVFE